MKTFDRRLFAERLVDEVGEKLNFDTVACSEDLFWQAVDVVLSKLNPLWDELEQTRNEG